MSVAHSSPQVDDQVEPVQAGPLLPLLFNLPEVHQATPVLRALVCCDEAAFIRGLRAGLALGQMGLASSRPS